MSDYLVFVLISSLIAAVCFGVFSGSFVFGVGTFFVLLVLAPPLK